MADEASLTNAPAREPTASGAAGEGGPSVQSNAAGDQGTCTSVDPNLYA
jgi:hypothetical protein